MIVRRAGGMTEFIPSPREKREGVIRDHALSLVENLHKRLMRIEEAFGLPLSEAHRFDELLGRIGHEESEVKDLNEKLMEVGLTHGERIES